MLSYTELLNPTDERVKKILEVAERHFSEYGFRKSAIGEICKDADISKPTFYKYFDKKETLFFAVFIYLSRTLYETCSQKSKELKTAAEKLSFYLESYEKHLYSNKLLAQMPPYNRELQVSWSGNPLSTEAYLHEVDFCEKIILEGIASGEFRVNDPRRTAHVVVLASSLIFIFQPGMPYYKQTEKSSAQFLADLLLSGLTK